MKRKGVTSILTVGDGNLTYSLSLALKTYEGSHITATTYDSLEDLKRKYGDDKIQETISTLVSHNAKVLHGVDATRLQDTLSSQRFDLIIFMHPLVPSDERYDFIQARGDYYATVIVNRLMLVRFLRSAQLLLAEENSEIHITMKNVYPYSWWRIDNLAAHAAPLNFLGSLNFQQVEHYESRNVERDTPFPLTASVTFRFGKFPGFVSDKFGKLRCEICACKFSGEGDQKKHEASLKHKKRSDLEIAWAEYLKTISI